jgi:hypothetical protein
MKNEKLNLEMDQVDNKIQQFIKKKKDENSALKKLLSALENAKKNTIVSNKV